MESLPIIISILASIIVGISKAGVKGIGVFFVILLAYAYEPKISTGILLPLLIVGDLFAIIYYKKNIVWKYIFQLIPWMAIGVLFATLTGDIIDEIGGFLEKGEITSDSTLVFEQAKEGQVVIVVQKTGSFY